MPGLDILSGYLPRFQRCDCKPINYKLLSPGTSVKGLLYPGEVVNVATTAGSSAWLVILSICHSTCPVFACPPTKQGLPSCLLLEQPQAARLPSRAEKAGRRAHTPALWWARCAALIAQSPTGPWRWTPTSTPLLVQPRLSCSLPQGADILSFVLQIP